MSVREDIEQLKQIVRDAGFNSITCGHLVDGPETVIGDRRDEITELKARIRELEGYLHDQGLLGKDYFERIFKAKAILEDAIPLSKHDRGLLHMKMLRALAALEGK